MPISANQQNVRSSDGVTEVGVESTFGTASSAMARVFLVGDTGHEAVDGQRTELENEDESVYVDDAKDPVEGLKIGMGSLNLYAKPAPQLLAGVTPLATGIPGILQAALGGLTADEGTEVDAGATTTDVPLVDVSVVQAGMVIGVGVGGVIEPVVVASIVGSSIIPVVPLSAAPAAGQLVVNGYNAYLRSSNSRSLTVAHAFTADPDSDEQLRGRGGIVEELEFGFNRNQLLTLKAKLKYADWDGPSGGLVSSSAWAADTFGKPFALVGAVTWLQDASVATRPAQYPVYGFSLKVETGMVLCEEHGGVNGHTNAMRVGKRLAQTLSVKVPQDSSLVSMRNARTPLRFMHAVPSGTGTAKRWNVMWCPNVVIVGEPKKITEGGRRMYEIALRPKLQTAGAAEIARAGWIYATL